MVLKLKAGEFAGELRIIPGRFLYLVEGSYEKPKKLSERGKVLRSLLSNARITNCEMIRGERIIAFDLEKGERRLKLICEFLPKGTVVVLDEKGEIHASLHRLEMRDRKIIPGESYKFPPSKQFPLTSELLRLFEKLTPRRSVVSALAVEAGLGGRYAEEILHIAKVDPSKKVRELSRTEVENILKAAQKVLDSAEHGSPMIAHSPDGRVEALPYPMESLKHKGWRFEKAKSLNDAFRIAYEHELAEKLEEEKKKSVESKIKELEKKAHEKRFSGQRLLKKAEILKKSAEKLSQLAIQLESLKSKPGKHEIDGVVVSVDKAQKKMKIRIDEEEIEFSLGESIMRQVSKLFDSSKKARQAAQRLLTEAEELEEKAKKLKKEIRETLEQALLQVSARVKIRKGRWYEKYRWFITSEGFLAAAGKDASSNIALLKKHLERNDLVFHAEVRGAAAVILKNGKDSGEKSKIEAAQFAAAYSKAWKDKLSVMTVYYVEPDQISFTPPPGHYLPKGGFIIKGERKYLTVKLELAIGLSESLELIYGPPSALAKKAKNVVKLIPGNRKAEELAEEIVKIWSRKIEIGPKIARELKMGITEVIPYKRGELLRM